MTSAAPLTRIRLYDGSRLVAKDLAESVGATRRLREMHVRAVHRTWGVALGFDVEVEADGRSVLVGPGLAHDIYGREIVSARTLQLRVPPPPTDAGGIAEWTFDLVVRYDDRSGAPSNGCADDGCDGEAPSAREERPAWRWADGGERLFTAAPRLASDVRTGIEVPLARVVVDDDGRCVDVELALRRHTQPLRRPYVARGRLPRGSVNVAGSMWAWSADVDTTVAAFTTAQPLYLVTLGGDPLAADSAFDALLPADRDALRAAVLGPYVAVGSVTARGFTVTARTVAADAAALALAPAVMHRQFDLPLPVDLSWIGIESGA